jgi:putative NIF3 family GTP cyclohydrolase 1 type 2
MSKAIRAITAGEIVDRIKKELGPAWRENTYRDTFKFGGPETLVTGIATTFMGTFDAIRRASAAGLNMIIPHEDTYWNDRDDTSIVSGDPLYKIKNDFMAAHNIVIFRMHDSMHAMRPDFEWVGLGRDLGLDPKAETAPNSHHYTVPETTLGALAARVKSTIGARGLRVVGDPAAKVSRLQIGVGYATPPVNSPDVDVVISGEQQEIDGTLDSPEYVLDAATLGVPKGWIMLGHAVSEEPGMLNHAEWLRTFIPEVPIQLVRAGEPFWTV